MFQSCLHNKVGETQFFFFTYLSEYSAASQGIGIFLLSFRNQINAARELTNLTFQVKINNNPDEHGPPLKRLVSSSNSFFLYNSRV